MILSHFWCWQGAMRSHSGSTAMICNTASAKNGRNQAIRLIENAPLDKLLPSYRYKASHKALFHCVMARIANPDSKRGSVKTLAEDFGVDLNLEKVYRMMDQLDDQRVERLKHCVAQQSQSLLKAPLNVLFFDCTTLYFESFTESSLKNENFLF